jgi:hypothetical protein
MSRPRLIVLVLLSLLLVPAVTQAEELIWATGCVKDAAGKPMQGAMVAIYNDKNQVVDYAKTDADGSYALAVPRGTLHLDKKAEGFFRKVAGAVGGVGRIAAMPLKMGIKAAAGIATASDPITRVGIGTASGVAQGLVDVMAPRERKKPAELRKMPGVVVVKVTAAGHNDVVSLARIYWMEEQVFRAGGRDQKVVTTWVDPVKMTQAGSTQPSTFDSTYLTFTEARLEPSIAEVGQKVMLTTRLQLPPEPRTPIVVVARNSRTGDLVELERIEGSVYGAEITIDKEFPKNDQTFTILAYAEQDERPGRSKKVEDALVRQGFFQLDKGFVYNPLVVVSRNRAEVVLTVVEPARRRR